MTFKKGLAANFTSPQELVRAARQVHKSGIKKFDVFTPYPIHGLDEAMDVKSSHIPWFSLIFGLIGAAAGLYFQWWTSVADWKLNIGGKPHFSLPAFIPVTFELGILFSAFASFIALFYFCKLPKYESIFEKDAHALKATDDQFMIFVESSDANFNEHHLRDIFNKHHAEPIRWIGAGSHE